MNSIENVLFSFANQHLEVPCQKCPFRKDRPFWMDRGRKIMNVLRVRQKIVQDCMTNPFLFCEGMAIMLNGGNDYVFSVEEFISEPPCPFNEMQERYDAK
jgi:hypothetical protein